MHLRWPNAFRRGRWWAGESRAYRPNNNCAKQVAEVLDFMKQAQAYANEIATPPTCLMKQ